MYELANKLTHRLSSLDPGDDFVVSAAAHPRAQSEYLAIVALGWLGDIQRIFTNNQRHPKKGALQRRIADIVALLPVSDEQQREMADVLRAVALRVPAQHHFDLIRTPFFALDDQHLVHVPQLDGATWNAEIRARWLRDGKVGKRFGQIWEGLFAHLLRSVGWRVAGPGVKLRTAQGTTVTDVDLLAVCDDVLLVIQVKGQAGQGINPYDQWRARRTVEQGVRQARAAVTIIDSSRRERLQSIFSASIAKNVRKVQPLVITNLHVFNGWKPDGVPVLSRGGLNTILNGGVVTYEDGRGRPAESIAIADQSNKPAEQFLDMLLNPIDWRIAQETLQVVHAPHMVEGNTFLLPQVGTWQNTKTSIAVPDGVNTLVNDNAAE